MKRTKVIDALQCTEYGKDINVKGWVRSHRSSKAVDFIALNDGSTINNIQIVVDPASMDAETLKNITTTGTAVVITTHNIPMLNKYPGIVYRCKNGVINDVTTEYNKMDLSEDAAYNDQ